jgi:hypothetical protein
MKTRTLLLLCLLLGFSVSQLSAQTLKKGAVVAVSTYEMTLNPDVSMNQFLNFYINKYIPEFEKNFPGVKEYLMWGDRGEKKNMMGSILVFESVAARDKYYPTEDGTTTSDAVKAANEKMKAMDVELSKFVVSGKRTTYTDWVIK